MVKDQKKEEKGELETMITSRKGQRKSEEDELCN